MDSVPEAVRKWIADTGLSSNRLSQLAGISQSTMSRVLGGRVDPAVGTLVEIALACGLDLDLATRPSSDPAAARAARAMLEAGFPADGDAHLSQWRERLTRFSGATDPISLLTTAARYASPLMRPGVELFGGEITVGQLASAGDAAQGLWALSGAAGLTLPEPHEFVPATTILWTQNTRRVVQLLTDSRLERTTRPARATVAVLVAEPALFTHAFTQGIVRYVAPIQLMLDCLAQGGAVAADALAEVESW